jgi:hypothetical protein
LPDKIKVYLAGHAIDADQAVVRTYRDITVDVERRPTEQEKDDYAKHDPDSLQ